MRIGSDFCCTFPPLALWKKIFDVPDLEISLPAPSEYVYLEIHPIHGMRIHDLGICVSYRDVV
jgi:hypothetical protein